MDHGADLLPAKGSPAKAARRSDEMAALEAVVAQRLATEPTPREPQRMSGPLVGALDRMGNRTTTEANKQEIKTLIIDRITKIIATSPPLPNEGTFDVSVAGRAADAVVFHGLPYEVLTDVLDMIERNAKAGGIKTTVGGYFNSTIQRRCGDRKVPWPGKRHQQQARGPP